MSQWEFLPLNFCGPGRAERSGGVVEYWSIGVLECWTDVVREGLNEGSLA